MANEINAELVAWRAAGKHLPDILRDFHDAKDVFKTMHRYTNVEGHEYCKDITWVAGQCYVIDIFLWFMARHGYTLQRSRAQVPFEDIHQAIAARQAEESQAFAAMLAERSK